MTDGTKDRLRARIENLSPAQRLHLAEALDLSLPSEPGELVAYVVGEGRAPGVDDIKPFMDSRLPRYMIPTRYLFLDALPRAASGKLDRRALSGFLATDRSIERQLPSASGAITAPRTDSERALAEIWKAVLDTDEVDVHDDFFELGGDSILSIRIISRANKVGLTITPEQFFTAPTIAELAKFAEGEENYAEGEENSS